TIDDLAEEFDFTHDFVVFALKTLEKMQMIECYDDIIYIKNWEKYQSSDRLEKIREQTRKRVEKHRKNKEVAHNQHVTLHVTQSNAGEEELELDKELDKEKDQDFSEKIKALFPVFEHINDFPGLQKQYWDVVS